MIRSSFVRTTARIAARDLRGSLARSALITITLVIAVASIAGVRSAAGTSRDSLEGDSRAWLGGDVGVDTIEPVSPNQTDELTGAALDWTLVTLASTMASSEESADPGFISVKAIDPAVYPFYGKLIMNPPRSLQEILSPDTVAVSEEVLERLKVGPGDSMLVAGRSFRIAAVIQSDQTRFSNDMGIGMRCILSQEAFARLGLESSGNSVRNRILIRTSDLARGRRMLEALFPGGSIRDYRAGYRQQTETAISFLSLTAFLCLVLGAIAVAITVREQAEQGLPAFAVMKMLGARSSHVVAVFLSQVGAMAAAAFVLGIPLGRFVCSSILSLAGKYVVLPAHPTGQWGLLIETTAAALIAMAPVLIQPMLMIRNVRPAQVLRRDVETQASGVFEAGLGWVVATASFLMLSALAHTVLGSWVRAVTLIATLTAGLGLAWAVTAGAFRMLARRSFAAPRVRYVIAALCRPGNRSRILVVALSTSLALLITTLVTSGVVVRAIFEMLPVDRNGLYIARFQDTQVDALRGFLKRQPGVGKIETITEARLHVRRVDDGNGFDLPYVVVCDQDAAPGALTMSDDVARQFRARVGSRIQFEARDQTIDIRVAVIRKLTATESLASKLRIDCRPLDRRTLFHQALVSVAPDRMAEVRRAVVAEYPTFAVVTSEDLSEAVNQVSQDAMAASRVVAWYAIGAGLAVLTAVVASSRRSRLREIGILSALGATRSVIRGMYTLEFAAIGLLSAAIASVLTCGFTTVMLSLLFHRLEVAIEWRPVAGAALIAVVLAIGGGWLPALQLLSRTPMEIMRRE
jgi:putative ABC transport system permease protein